MAENTQEFINSDEFIGISDGIANAYSPEELADSFIDMGSTEVQPENIESSEDAVQDVVEQVDTQEETPIEAQVEAQTVVEDTPVTESVTEEKVQIDPFKELGFEDEKDKKFISQLHEAYKEGKLTEFIEKVTTDYSKVPDIELLKMQFENKYPSAEKDDIDLLMERKLQEYGYTGGEDEVADAKATKLLRLDMMPIREELQKQQEEFKNQAFTKQPSPDELKAQKDWEEFVSFVDNNAEFNEFGRNKTLSFGEFKIEAPQDFDPKKLAKDPTALLGKFFDNSGKLKVNEFIEFALVGTNAKKAINDAIAFGKAVATKEFHDKLRGVDGGKGVSAPPTAQNGRQKMVLIN